MISVDIKSTLNSLNSKVLEISKAVNRAIKVNGMEYARDLRQAVGLNKSRYRQYRRRGVVHWSSRPGHYPNTDTGWLKHSIFVTGIRNNAIFVKVTAKYARKLEFGNGRVRARPFATPIRNAKEKRFRIRIANALNRVR